MNRQVCFVCWIIIYGLIVVNGLQEWNLEEYCNYGRPISTSEVAGVLHFDASRLSDFLPYSRENECIVTLKPDRVFPGQYQDERIGLYFTEFDLPYCGAANITLFDGPDTYYSIVKGAAESMCGHNETLLTGDVFFNTTNYHGSLTLRYAWTGLVSKTTGKFSMKFNAFYKGDCDKEGVNKCPDGRCIKDWTYCHGDIYGCASVGAKDNCNFEEDMKDFGEKFTDSLIGIVKDIGIILAVIVGIVIVIKVVKAYREKLFQSRPQTLVQMSQVLQSAGSGDHQEESSLTNPVTDNNDIQLTQYTPDSENTNETIRYGSTENTSDVMHEPSTVTPTAPPPSYEDAMAPSYDDVMANREKYKT